MNTNCMYVHLHVSAAWSEHGQFVLPNQQGQMETVAAPI